MFRRSVTPSLLIFSGLLAGGIAMASARTLSPDETVKLIAGTAIETVTRRSARPFIMEFKANGTMDGRITAPSSVNRDQGRWWIGTDEMFCYQWKHWGRNEASCYFLDRVKGGIQRLRKSGKPTKRIWSIKALGPKAHLIPVALSPRAARSPGSKAVVPNPFAGVHFGNYHALVIGNNDYRTLIDLKMAVADATAVSDLLRRDYGFRVDLKLNATRADIMGSLARLRATLTANDSLFVYFAGHGIVDAVTEQGYWLPVDAAQNDPTNWVSTSDITNMLRGIRSKHIMVVADSCYSGTLVRSVPARIKTARERRVWIERMLNKRSRTALVSGGLEPVPDGGGGGHSVFARALLGVLSENDGVLEGSALYDAIKRPIALNSEQTPQYSDIRRSGHEGGDFIFVRQ